MTDGEVWYLLLVGIGTMVFFCALVYGSTVASGGPRHDE
jgi:hypothetical protein